MRILQELAAKIQRTPRQLGLILPDVAQASLYRHLKAMLQDKVLEVVSENKVHGTVERTYRIKHNPFQELDEQGASLDNASLLSSAIVQSTWPKTVPPLKQSVLAFEPFSLLSATITYSCFLKNSAAYCSAIAKSNQNQNQVPDFINFPSASYLIAPPSLYLLLDGILKPVNNSTRRRCR